MVRNVGLLIMALQHITSLKSLQRKIYELLFLERLVFSWNRFRCKYACIDNSPGDCCVGMCYIREVPLLILFVQHGDQQHNVSHGQLARSLFAIMIASVKDGYVFMHGPHQIRTAAQSHSTKA